MSKKTIYIVWAALFAACAGLGFVPEPEGWVRWALSALALCFFVPPLYLLYRAQREGDRGTAALVRNLAALSLGLTMLTLILNFLCAVGSERVGNMLYYLLTIVSAPMICGGHWAGSLFLWACLLVWAVRIRRAGAK